MGGISMTKFTNFIAKLISIVLGIFVLINVYGMVINSYIARRLVKDTTHQIYFFLYLCFNPCRCIGISSGDCCTL